MDIYHSNQQLKGTICYFARIDQFLKFSMVYWIFPLQLLVSFIWNYLWFIKEHDWTWSEISLFMMGQYMLVQVVTCILMMPGWSLWNICKHFDLNIEGMKNLPFHVMQEYSMTRSSFSCLWVSGSWVDSYSVQTNLPTSADWRDKVSVLSFALPSEFDLHTFWSGLGWVHGS